MGSIVAQHEVTHFEENASANIFIPSVFAGTGFAEVKPNDFSATGEEFFEKITLLSHFKPTGDGRSRVRA